MDALRQDVKYAVRRLARSPTFTVVAVLSLGLGIGANTAIFSLVNAVLIRELPFQEPERLVEVYTSEENGLEHSVFSYPDYLDLAASTREVFSGTLASNSFFARVDDESGNELAMGEMVTEDYFSVLGVEPHLGRGFFAEENASAGTHPVAVISHDYWTSRFGADPEIVGSALRLNGRSFMIVGVAGQELTGSYPLIMTHLWVPVMMSDQLQEGAGRLDRRNSRNLFVKARLRPGVSVQQARAAVVALGQGLAEAYPETNDRRGMTLLPASEVALHPLVDRALLPVAALLMGVVGLVLLIACANLASFLLARAADRRKEIALRLALGARRSALIRQLLTETLLLAVLGGAAGLVLAHWTLALLLGFQPPVPIPVDLDVSLDRNVLLFTMVVSGLAGVAFGLAPALQATKPELAPALKDESNATSGRSRRFSLRNALVVTQVAVSLVLLIGSGLFLRSLRETQAVHPGFDTSPGAIIWVNLPLTGIEDPDEGLALYNAMSARLLALPGVTAVGTADRLPLGIGIQTEEFEIPGVDPPPGTDAHVVDFTNVGTGYFDAMGVEVLLGRPFGDVDGREAEPAAIVSEAFVRRYWPGEDPLGKVLVRRGSEIRVVGVARDTKVRTIGEAPRPYVYRPAAQTNSLALQIVVRAAGPEQATLVAAREAVREVRPDLMIMESKTMTDHLALMLFPPRMGALLLSVFGTLALGLAVVGLYGVISYTVARRTREMGIRMSLGASAGDVARLVVGGGMRLVLIGGGIGMALAAGLSTAVGGFLYGVRGLDPVTFAAVPFALAVVSLIAAYLPARRAGRVSPMEALRYE